MVGLICVLILGLVPSLPPAISANCPSLAETIYQNHGGKEAPLFCFSMAASAALSVPFAFTSERTVLLGVRAVRWSNRFVFSRRTLSFELIRADESNRHIVIYQSRVRPIAQFRTG